MEFEVIKDKILTDLIDRYEICIDFVSNLDYPIKVDSYPYFLRLSLNFIQIESFDYLIDRVNLNKELERNEGGYSTSYLGENNPKIALLNLIYYLKSSLDKQKKINNFLKVTSKTITVTDRNDIDFIRKLSGNNLSQKLNFMTLNEFKKTLNEEGNETKTVMFYSFNGLKDFSFIYHLNSKVKLILFEQEFSLFQAQLRGYKTQLEDEIRSNHRFNLCGVEYNVVTETPVFTNRTLENIIQHLEDRSNIAYEGYKEEADSILEELEDTLLYKFNFAETSESYYLESSDTVFSDVGDLVKTYKLSTNDKIRIYPKEHLADNLFQVAVDTEPDIFGKVGQHSKLWLDILKALDSMENNREKLFNKLKGKGLKVLPATVDSYFNGKRKFPMYNSDLKAIIELSDDPDLIKQIPHILKSKRLYNSTMIALGRGIKQELRLYLKEKKMGEILEKRKFTNDTLKRFIETEMPLLTISKIEKIEHE